MEVGQKFCWQAGRRMRYGSRMKSCLALLFVLGIFILVIGGGALLWYLSNTAEFSKAESNPPVAIPVHPRAVGTGRPPVAIPVKPQPHR